MEGRMLMMILMLAILLAGVGVFVWLYLSAQKEKVGLEESSAVPITDVSEIQSAHLPAEAVQESDAGVNKPVIGPVVLSGSPVATMEERIVPTPEVTDRARSEDTIRQLNEEIKLIREKAVIQAKNAIEVINKLREDNDQLRSEAERFEKAAEKPKADEELLTHLRAENMAFKEQLTSSSREIEELRQKMTRSESPAGGQLGSDQETIQRLEAENAELRLQAATAADTKQSGDAVQEQYLKDIALLAADLEAARKENERLRNVQTVDVTSLSPEGDPDLAQSRREEDDLKNRVNELEKLVKTFEENNRFLQYELTKSRAQAAGLERICENSRKQFAEIARGAREAEQDNQALKSQTRILEQSLTDFKKLNVELLKREKLTQFEMEKNLDQIRDLEGIYGVFRSRLARLGISEEDLVKD
jgi:hypothetical protein